MIFEAPFNRRHELGVAGVFDDDTRKNGLSNVFVLLIRVRMWLRMIKDVIHHKQWIVRSIMLQTNNNTCAVGFVLVDG